MKIGFIGAGKMASAIITGLKQQTDISIMISQATPEKSQLKADELGVIAASSHAELIAKSDMVILGIKPQQVESVLADLQCDKPLISILAGISLERLAQLTSPALPICRIMPNLNAQILKSSTALVCNANVTDDIYQMVINIVNAFGTAYPMSEKDLDGFTALAGSSPAYIALFIEAMAKAGVSYGFSKETALAIITETLIATGQTLSKTQESPHDFIDRVASPAGLTIAGLIDLEKTGFTASVISALDATINKSKTIL